MVTNNNRDLLTRSTRRVLTVGYVNENFKYRYITTDITNMIFSYFNNGITWNISKNQLINIKKYKYKEILYGPKFSILNGLKCQLILFPSGYTKEGVTQCFLKIDALPINVEYITMKIIITSNTYNRKLTRTLSFDQQSNINPIGWNIHHEKSLDLYTSFALECAVDVIHVKYKQDGLINNIITSNPSMKAMNNQQFVFNVNAKLLDTLKLTKSNGIEFSNKIWKIACFPQYRDECYIGLQILSLPFNVESVDILYNLSIFCDNKLIINKLKLCTFSFDIGNSCHDDQRSDYKYDSFSSQLFKSSSLLQFVVEIEIIELKYYDH